MSVTLTLLGVGTIARAILQPGILCLGFVLLYGLYLLWRIRKPAVCALWILLSVPFVLPQEPEVPEPGIYTIVEVKAGYTLARKDGVSVVCRSEDAGIYDQVQLTEFEKLEGLKNLGVFSFAKAMEDKGIHYQAEGPVISRSSSLQAKIMNHFQSDEMAMRLLYGIRQEPSLLDSSGLPVLALLLYSEKAMCLCMEKKKTRKTVVMLAVMAGWLLGWKASLVRFVLFKGIRLLWEDRLGAWGLSVLAFSWLLPEETGNFSLVFPALLQLTAFIAVEHKGWFSRLLMMCLQTVYFGQISLLSFFGFSLLKMYAAVMLVCVFLPFQLPVVMLDLSVDVNFNFVIMVLMVWSLGKWLLAGEAPLLTAALCFLLFFGQYVDPFFHVYMVDIGQGDCTVIVEPFMKSVVMIDCGQNLYRDNVEKIVIPFLGSRKIDRLDCLIVTHDDFDHSGGVEALCQHIPVEKVITDREEQVPVSYPFLSLLPQRECVDENEESIISCFSYDGFVYLWMGDADVKIEKDLLQAYPGLSANVLKAGHHGSATSTCWELLDQTDPDMCLISVGRNNRYGHPSAEVMNRLRSGQVGTFLTSEHGMVHISTFGKLKLLETASGYVSFLN